MLRVQASPSRAAALIGAATVVILCACGLGTGPNDVAIAAVSVSPPTATLTAVGATQQFVATALDSAGNAVAVSLSWVSSNTQVATVDASGLAQAVGAGGARIIVEAGLATDTASLVVSLPKNSTTH